MPAAGSSVQPCRRASSIVCLARSSAARERPLVFDRRLVGQAGELQIGPTDLRASTMPWSRCGAASANRAAQYSALPRLISASARSSSPRPARRLRGLGRGLQPPRLLRHHRQIPALARQPAAGSPRAAACACPRRGGAGPTPPRRAANSRKRSASPAIPAPAHRPQPPPPAQHPPPRPEREPGQDRVHRRGLPAQMQAGPVAGLAGGRPAPSPAPPARAGSPPLGTRAPRTTRAATWCSPVSPRPGAVRRSSSCSRSANR